jgi:hypothetical protein
MIKSPRTRKRFLGLVSHLIKCINISPRSLNFRKFSHLDYCVTVQQGLVNNRIILYFRVLFGFIFFFGLGVEDGGVGAKVSCVQPLSVAFKGYKNIMLKSISEYT